MAPQGLPDLVGHGLGLAAGAGAGQDPQGVVRLQAIRGGQGQDLVLEGLEQAPPFGFRPFHVQVPVHQFAELADVLPARLAPALERQRGAGVQGQGVLPLPSPPVPAEFAPLLLAGVVDVEGGR